MTITHTYNEVPPTVAEALGQIDWVFTQSATHKELPFKILEGTVMPALSAAQLRVFRFGKTPAFDGAAPEEFAKIGFTKHGLEELPLGFALWAFLSEEAEGKLEAGEKLTAEDWKSGDKAWLIELMSPFATEDNQLMQTMLMDLMQGPFKNTPFKLHRTDTQTGKRTVVSINQHLNTSVM
jgi:cytolysin-activating lysine-acyltransferase